MKENQFGTFPEKNIPVADDNPNPVLGIRADGFIVYANPASETLLYLLQTAVNKTLPDSWIVIIKEVIESEKTRDIEIQLGEKDYHINMIPILGKERIFIYCYDISIWKQNIQKNLKLSTMARILNEINEKNKNEIRLKESEAKYRSLVEAGQDFIYSADFNGNFVYMNPVGLKKIGYTADEITGKNFTYLIRKDWKKRVADFYNKQFFEKKENSYLEFPVVSKNGTEWWVGQNVMMLTENNWVKGFQAYARDITERKKAEEDLKSQQIFTNTILDNLPINIFLKDKEGKYWFVNKQALDILKMKKEEVIGKDARVIHSENYAINASASDEKAWNDKTYFSEEKMIINGEEKYFLIGKMVLEINEFDEPLLLGYSIDITERNKTEMDLLQAKQKAEELIITKEKFISIMSHEIRTPMNAVVGITNLLLQQDYYPEQKEYFNALKISSGNLLKILNNVLDLSKIESDKVFFEEIDFQLSEVIMQVKELFLFQATEKNILLDVKIDEQVPEYIKGDSHRLNQILVNLMSNAIKFTDEGKVSLTVHKLEDKNDQLNLIFTIEDSGVGISEDRLLNIFESFTQANSEITRKYGGTGLGLTITKRLIELQGGNIFVESNLNEGSRFSFNLFFAKSERLKPMIGKSRNVNLAGLYALVVEDNKMNQMVATKFLEKENVKVDVADNGKIALELLSINKNKYDIILMDLQMPEMDGFETARNIRNKLMVREIPIIAFTASSSLNIEKKVMEAGMNDYIVKPFEPSNFYSIIANNTNRSEEQEELNLTMHTTNYKRIDLSYIKDAASGNTVFIKEMIHIFLMQTPNYLSLLKEYRAEGNWEEFRKIIHKLKPTITMMGIKQGDHLVKEIEAFVKGKVNLDKVEALLANLENICIESYKELNQELLLLN